MKEILEEITLNQNGYNNKFKRKPKNPIKFKLQLNKEQKEAKAIILHNDITVLDGKTGSGKTLLACQIALDQYFTKQVETIYIIRSTVSKEDLGFLPGDLYDKMEPWLQPIVGNLYLLYDKQKIDKMFSDGVIQIVPIGYMRGRTFTDAFIIVDECQNITDEQLEMILCRLGYYSKMVLCGDESQNDFKRKSDSGFGDLISLHNLIKGFGHFNLKTNHRHPIVDAILIGYKQIRQARLDNKAQYISYFIYNDYKLLCYLFDI